MDPIRHGFRVELGMEPERSRQMAQNGAQPRIGMGMRHKTNIGVYSYWRDLCRNRSVPLRHDIDPGALTALLPNLFILEMEPNELARFRLAGTALCMLKGRELRGNTLRGLLEAGSCARIESATELVVAARQPLLIDLSATTTRGDVVELEMVMLPVASVPGRVDRIFGSLACLVPGLTFDEQIGPMIVDNISCLARDGEIDHVRADRRDEAPMVAARVATKASPFGNVMRRILQFRVLDGGKQ